MAADCGTPRHEDACQELLVRMEHSLIFARDHAAEALGKADPLTELHLRQLSREIADLYTRTLALRSARNAHYAG